MPRQKKKSEVKQTNPFHDELEQALEHFRDPAWLGEHSPLASPYFLGEYLLERDIDPSDPVKRGNILKRLLDETVKEVQEKDTNNKLLAQLLRLTYLIPEQLMATVIAEQLYISRRNYFRYKKSKEAIEVLATMLQSRLKPALRLEVPTAQPQLIGRDELLEHSLSALAKGNSVGLMGPCWQSYRVPPR